MGVFAMSRSAIVRMAYKSPERRDRFVTGFEL